MPFTNHVLHTPDAIEKDAPHNVTTTSTPKGNRIDWKSAGLLAGVIAFLTAGVVALFLFAPLALPLGGAAWLCWGVREARSSLHAYQGWRSRLRVCCRLAGIASTGMLLVAGIVAPICWVLGITLLVVHALLATRCAPPLLQNLLRTDEGDAPFRP